MEQIANEDKTFKNKQQCIYDSMQVLISFETENFRNNKSEKLMGKGIRKKLQHTTLNFMMQWSTEIKKNLNSSPPSATYMRQLVGSTLVQIMACRLFGAKPLSQPMLRYCQLDPWEQTLVKF